MSLIGNSNNTRRTRSNSSDEVSEFDGCWLNLGVNITKENEDKDTTEVFVRLPLGVPVAQLKTRPVYETMDPDFASQVAMSNQMITLIQEACNELAEGEGKEINLSVQVYRRQEESKEVADTGSNDNLRNVLFG